MAIHTLDWQQTPPGSCRGGAVTVGNFNGVHRGHERQVTLQTDAHIAGAEIVEIVKLGARAAERGWY